MKLDFNDLVIVPKEISNIQSRSEVSPFYGSSLPLFTAPMDTVISLENSWFFKWCGIKRCFPRNTPIVYYSDFGRAFYSYSISEMRERLDRSDITPFQSYLIDIANGHMQVLVDLIRDIKEKFPVIKLMVGNVANPKTYTILSDAGADYIRVGIGNGGGCLTTQNTGVGYPMASLIRECYEESLKLTKPAKIVADGGMKDYSDIIKALALGADYVMLGSIFNKALESAGDNFLWKRIRVPQKLAEIAYKWKIPVFKKFRGMSTKEVQRKWGAKTIKTSEGVVRFRRVEYTLIQWRENFEHYLRSAMSYSNARTLEEFIGHADLVEISDNAYKRFNK
jgi:GMP reductase